MADNGAPQEHIAVSLGWRLADDRWVKAIYNARVVSYEADKDRWLVVLENQLTAPADLAGENAELRDLIAGLVGKWAYVPAVVRDGVTLPLKYATLTGAIRFFYAEDPRRK